MKSDLLSIAFLNPYIKARLHSKMPIWYPPEVEASSSASIRELVLQTFAEAMFWLHIF